MKLATQRTDQLEDLKQLWRAQIEISPKPPHPLLLDHFFSHCVERVIDTQEILKILDCPGELDEASITLSVGRAVSTECVDLSELAWCLSKNNYPKMVLDVAGAPVPVFESLYYLGQIIFESRSPDEKTQLTLYNFGKKRAVYAGALRSVIERYEGKKTESLILHDDTIHDTDGEVQSVSKGAPKNEKVSTRTELFLEAFPDRKKDRPGSLEGYREFFRSLDCAGLEPKDWESRKEDVDYSRFKTHEEMLDSWLEDSDQDAYYAIEAFVDACTRHAYRN